MFIECSSIYVSEFKTILTCAYIPPSQSSHQSEIIQNFFIDNFDQFLVNHPYSNLCVCGDFNNFDFSPISTHFDLCNIVNKPTRQNSILDFVYVPKHICLPLMPTVAIESPIGNSDHNTIHVAGISTPSTYREVFVYDLRQSNIDAYLDSLNSINWNTFYNSEVSIDDKSDMFYDLLMPSLLCIPKYKIIYNHKDKPWISPITKHLINLRWYYFRARNFTMYNHYKIKVKEEIQKSKILWSKRLLQKNTNIWKITDELTGKNKILTQKSNALIESKENANRINAIFQQVFQKPNADFTEIIDDGWAPTISVETVEKLLASLKKNSTGSDNVCSNFLKLGSRILAKPIAHLFNLSIIHRHIPTKWKCADIIPIPKSYPPDINNLRPISLLPILVKCLEKALLLTIKSEIVSKYDKHQFGFRPLSSTTCAVIDIHDKLAKIIDDKKLIGAWVISFDMSKAFDKVSHPILIEKLQTLDLPKGFILWMKNYLCNRSQKIRLGKVCSDVSPITSGVPQGACLSPYLFSLFMADLKPKHSSTHMIKYADDVTIICPYKNSESNIQCRDESDNIEDWCTRNKLILNVSKTKAMFVTRKRNHDIAQTFTKNDIEISTSIKILGVIFNNSLTWNNHVDNIVKKASQRLYIIRSAQSILPKKQLIAIYNSYIRSILEYSSPVFIGLPNYLSTKLDRLQNRCHNIICRRYDCSCNIFDSLIIRRKQLSIKLFNIIRNNNSHILNSHTPHTLPASGHLFIPHCNTTCRIKSYFIQMSIHTNSLM